MLDLFRWQWMWKSRSRVLGLAAASVAIGGLLILFAATRGDVRKAEMLVIIGGVTFVAAGAYQLLQGLLSPAGAFGEQDTSDVYARRKLARKLRRHARRADVAPIPFEDELRRQGEEPRSGP